MLDPSFWLGLSILLVAVSLTALLVVALPAFQELARAARSAEKLFDTLNRELPPTLEAIRLTGSEITSLSEDVGQNVQAAGRVVGQFDQGLVSLKQQAKQAQTTTRSFLTGVRAAWQTFSQPDGAELAEFDADEPEDELEDELETTEPTALNASQRPSQTAPPDQSRSPLTAFPRPATEPVQPNGD